METIDAKSGPGPVGGNAAVRTALLRSLPKASIAVEYPAEGRHNTVRQASYLKLGNILGSAYFCPISFL
jgi:hypothetical protein